MKIRIFKFFLMLSVWNLFQSSLTESINSYSAIFDSDGNRKCYFLLESHEVHDETHHMTHELASFG